MKIILIIIVVITLVFKGAPTLSQELYRYQASADSKLSSFENKNGLKGQGGKTNMGAKGNAFEEFGPGETKELLNVTGAGIIQRIWLTYTRNPVLYRCLRFRIYWDNDKKPAVDVPLGDFFVNNLGKPSPFESTLFSSPEGKSYNCFIPMPYRKAARVTITNESDSARLLLFYDISFVTLKSLPTEALYFHAFWNRTINAELGEDLEALPFVTGSGRFLGVNIGVNLDSTYGKTWWGEGEVKMFVDGDSKYPSWVGTGIEDYLGTGWGLGVYNHQFQGCLIVDTSAGKYSIYRWHIPDQIFFHKNLRVTLQQMGGGNYNLVKELNAMKVKMRIVSSSYKKDFYRLVEKPININNPGFPKGWVNFYRVDDYAHTAYFYLNKTSTSLPPLPDLKKRLFNYL